MDTSINSLYSKIFPSGSQKYRNLEQETLQKIQSMVIPYGINLSHIDKAKNFEIQKWMINRNVNSTLKEIFKQTALMGNLIVIFIKNEEDKNIDIYLNNLFGLSNIKLINMTPTSAQLTVQAGNSDGKSPLLIITVRQAKNFKNNKKWNIEIVVSNCNDEDYKTIARQLGQEPNNLKSHIKVIVSEVMPLQYFTYLPSNPVFTGILGQKPFNHTVRGKNNNGNDGLQSLYDQCCTMLQSELNTAYSTRVGEGLTAQEMKNKKSTSIATRIWTKNQGIPGNLNNTVSSSIDIANPQFNQLMVLDNIVRQYMEGCFLSYENTSSSINEADINTKNHLTKSFFNDLINHWDNQLFHMFENILKIMKIQTEDKEKFCFTCAIRKNPIGEPLKTAEERVYDIKNNLSSIEDEIADKYNTDNNNAKTILQQIIKTNQSYEDAIYNQEEKIAEIQGELQEAQNHPEDIADKDEVVKKEAKDTVDKESV